MHTVIELTIELCERKGLFESLFSARVEGTARDMLPTLWRLYELTNR